MHSSEKIKQLRTKMIERLDAAQALADETQDSTTGYTSFGRGPPLARDVLQHESTFGIHEVALVAGNTAGLGAWHEIGLPE